MRPFPIGRDTPSSMDDFAIAWPQAVAAAAPIPHARHAYLEAIARYTNDVPPGGIFAHEFLLAEDPELDRMLELVHALARPQEELVPRLLARTQAHKALLDFEADPAALEQRIREVKFSWVDPFLLEGELARYLYFYGMYEYFWQHHSAREARELARSLVRETLRDELEQTVAFRAHGPWGRWFDVHSCSDCSFLLVDRQTRLASLFCFSHSD
ncbi:hypothetical protein [Hyalangium gracile]|uniref:hypothetical protein n=1 Tax=Hyalangium gracile TaxID=394092 RepID=UPI001CCA5FAD|nr:hypothetical protein [Hyalangium gracile]